MSSYWLCRLVIRQLLPLSFFIVFILFAWCLFISTSAVFYICAFSGFLFCYVSNFNRTAGFSMLKCASCKICLQLGVEIWKLLIGELLLPLPSHLFCFFHLVFCCWFCLFVFGCTCHSSDNAKSLTTRPPGYSHRVFSSLFTSQPSLF